MQIYGENACFTSNFICIKEMVSKTITSKLKQVISSNDAASPQLPKNAVDILQHIFGSGHLLGIMLLMLTSGFRVLKAYKVAFAFK